MQYLVNYQVKIQNLNLLNIMSIDPSIMLTNYEKYYRGRFISTRLAKDLTFEQISKIEENKLNIEGIYYQQFPKEHSHQK